MSAPERDRLLGHAADNDGIEEYDNSLPAWWLWLFYGTIIWAVWYAVDYHFLTKRSQAGDYEAEMAAAEAEVVAARAAAPVPTGGAANPTGVIVPDAEQGKAIYASTCVGCHGPELKGGVGPDLTDATWIHGGTLEQITHTVSVGVPEKGMLAWGPVLGAEKVAHVSAYIHAAGGGQ